MCLLRACDLKKAMIKINLIDYRLKKRKKRVNLQIVLFFSVLVIVIALQLIANDYLKAKIKTTSSTLQNTIALLKISKKKESLFTQKSKEMNRLKDIIKEIKKFRANTNNPVFYMDILANAVIKNKIQLTGFEMQNDSFIIKGLSVNEKIISSFITDLKKLSVFKNVYLLNVKVDQISNKLVKSFEVICLKK